MIGELEWELVNPQSEEKALEKQKKHEMSETKQKILTAPRLSDICNGDVMEATLLITPRDTEHL